MYEVSSADQLAAILQFAFSPHLQSVIAIDGKDGVGKSTLSAQLCQEIGGTVISVDDHVEKGRGTYFPASHLSDVRSALFQAAAPRIVEGVCLRDVLEAIDCSSAVHVYVRRVIANGFWPDRSHLRSSRACRGYHRARGPEPETVRTVQGRDVR